MFNYKIKTSFFKPKYIPENWIYNDALLNLSLWLRTGSNPPDIDRLRSEKLFLK